MAIEGKRYKTKEREVKEVDHTAQVLAGDASCNVKDDVLQYARKDKGPGDKGEQLREKEMGLLTCEFRLREKKRETRAKSTYQVKSSNSTYILCHDETRKDEKT